MGWNGCDAVGEVLREGDEVKFLKVSDTGLEVGDVGVVHILEPLTYDGFANRQVYVKIGKDFWWMNHKWLLKV